jgi:hypothetical protein
VYKTLATYTTIIFFFFPGFLGLLSSYIEHTNLTELKGMHLSVGMRSCESCLSGLQHIFLISTSSIPGITDVCHLAQLFVEMGDS